MRIMIAENNQGLNEIWTRHFKRAGVEVVQVFEHDAALNELRFGHFDALIMNLKLSDENAIAITDVATYRNPDIAIILVTADRFFSDGSIFDLIPNARSFVNDQVRPDDLTAMIEHFTSHPDSAGPTSLSPG